MNLGVNLWCKYIKFNFNKTNFSKKFFNTVQKKSLALLNTFLYLQQTQTQTSCKVSGYSQN